MIKHLKSKTAIIIYIIAIIGLSFWAFETFKVHTVNAPTTPPQTFSSDSPSSLDATDDLINDNDADNQAAPNDTVQQTTDATATPDSTVPPAQVVDKDVPPVSSTQKVSGQVLANITPEHCSNGCQAFSIDLSLKEYCEQVCGISPIKNVSSCDGKKDIQKDYCTKDLAITKKDASLCEKITDANIKQTCKNRIAQDMIENVL